MPVHIDTDTREVTVFVEPEAAPDIAVFVEVRNGRDGRDGADAGELGMLKATYDPTEVEADVFDLSNHRGTINSPTVIIDGGLL